ncbi:MAG TPA: malto-oligosyltrehalose trehalohydrolase [Caulobacteraceae bacterium]|jgi:maltooligosyltrehalose trehalohydrolase|nr:malto-oligosyltrehalose trehalohydrolase [Caulobacteraceae bacterium]
MNSADFASNRFGPRIEPDGVVFQLWAPSAGQVAVTIGDAAPMAMARDPNGFWSAKAQAAPNTLYRFDVDGQHVPDPASRRQPSDVSGPSQLVDGAAYRWRHPNWAGRPWEDAVLYELHTGILGGFEGVRAKLAGIAALGVTAVELMPIADFAGARNWGYDGVLPFAPDSTLGEPDALRALIDEAHGLGLMVFLDVVYNHFGPEGNWLPAYVPEFFDPRKSTPWGPAINFGASAVRRFFIENALYWLTDFHFDGLRLDAVHAIPDRSWLIELANVVRGRFPDRHIHLVVENEANDAELLASGINAQWNDDFHNAMHVLLTGETHAYYAGFSQRPAELLARGLAGGFIYQGETPPNGSRPRGQPSGALPPSAFVNFLQNHDQVGNRAMGERLSHLADHRALKAAMALLLLCPQTPMLFMGEEVGAREPFLFFTAFQGDLARAVREGRRKEFAGQPGFDDPKARDRIPDPNAAESFATSRWTETALDAAEWRELVTTLLVLRHGALTPRLRGCRAIGAKAVGLRAVVARWRLSDGAILTLALNLDPDAVAADLPKGEPRFGQGGMDGNIQPFSCLAWFES